MLVLARFPGESIDVGSDIRVTVIRVRGDKVAIGIDAPGAVKIRRSELERKEAAIQSLLEIGDNPK